MPVEALAVAEQEPDAQAAPEAAGAERVGPGHPPAAYRFKPGNQASKGVKRTRLLTEELARQLAANDCEKLKEIVRETINDLCTSPKSRAALLPEVLNRIDGKIADKLTLNDNGARVKVLILTSDAISKERATAPALDGALAPKQLEPKEESA